MQQRSGNAAIGYQYLIGGSYMNSGIPLGTYCTDLYGNTNGGHLFGDALSATERKALLEYLKTL